MNKLIENMNTLERMEYKIYTSPINELIDITLKTKNGYGVSFTSTLDMLSNENAVELVVTIMNRIIKKNL